VLYRAEPYPEAPNLTPDAHVFIWMPGEEFGHALALKASSDRATILATVQRPIALNCFQEKAPVPAWRTKPSWFLVAEEDRMIIPGTQRFLAERIGETSGRSRHRSFRQPGRHR
jgi:hypothetical protein